MARGFDRWEENISKYDKLGCCGNMIRLTLFLINLVFFILGLVVFIAAAVLRWGDNTFSKFTDVPYFDEIIKVGSLGTVSIALMVIGAIILVLSFVGILGVKFLNKFFLIVYEVIVGIMFLTHGISLLVLLFSSDTIEEEYKKTLNSTMGHINSNDDKFTENCELMKGLSSIFHCCGNIDINDFKNFTIAEECCDQSGDKSYTVGCTDKSIQSIKDNAVNLLIIPSAIILVIELFALVMVPCIIGKSRD